MGIFILSHAIAHIYFHNMILIVGASSGIGEGAAVHFAKLGSRLSLAGRSADNLSRVSLLCREQGMSENYVRQDHFLT